MNMTIDTAVIGGGLSGLTAAHYVKAAGRSVVVLERSGRAGGVLRSERTDGYLLEFGANTIQIKPDLFELAQYLGLGPEMEIADARTPRYVLFQGKLHVVPMSAGTLITSDLLSLKGKMRLIAGAVVPGAPARDDEPMSAYVRRRFGAETAERLAAPFVSGVWAGDAAQLSAASAFPKSARGGRKHPQGLLSFKNGLETLTGALAASLHSELKTGVAVTALNSNDQGWDVPTEKETLTAKRVALCAPAAVSAQLVEPFAPEAAAALRAIPSASVAVLHLGFEEQQVGSPREGFGYLAAPSEKSDILGCLWNSNLFPVRAPAGNVLCTVFMGGTTNPAILALSDTDLVKKAVESLRPVMDVRGGPVFARVTRVERAIPQYTLGHAARLKTIEETERRFPGLTFGGNYRGGISIGDVVRSAKTSASLH